MARKFISASTYIAASTYLYSCLAPSFLIQQGPRECEAVQDCLIPPCQAVAAAITIGLAIHAPALYIH